MVSDSHSNGSIINWNIDLEKAIIFTVISLILVLFGGITSGLNVSLLSIDAKKTKLMTKLSEKNSHLTTKSQIKMMETLQPLIDDRHLLLVTLLVANASCMEALPIFLDGLVASWLAIIISVTFVLIFGEILPQALFTTDPLKSGYKLYYIVVCMKWFLYPICKPLAFILDLLFSDQHKKKGIVFSQKEVSMIMMEISKHPDERTVVEGALKIADYTVMDSIVTWNNVTCVDANMKLDANGLLKIFKTGLSRIPIYQDIKSNVIGILLVKSLIICDPNPDLTLKQYLMVNFKKVRKPALVSKNTPLYDCINIFQDARTHFAMVCEEGDDIDVLDSWRGNKPIPKYVKWVGIITLEDIMEDIIQEEFIDEFDVQTPLHAIFERSGESNKSQMDKWTEDASFVESVKSRFSAKNRRTMRAIQMKTRHLKMDPNDLLSDIEPLPTSVYHENVIEQRKKISKEWQSQPSLLTSINMNQPAYGAVVKSEKNNDSQ